MARVLKRAGVTAKDIEPGDIWIVPDELVVFPEDRLPDAKKKKHKHRTVVVLSCKEDCQSIRPLTILIAPLSTKKKLKARTDFLLEKDNGNLREDSFARLGLVQPVLKTDLQRQAKIGQLNKEIFDKMIAVLLANIGVIERPSSNEAKSP